MFDRIAALSVSSAHPALSMAKQEASQIDEQMDSARGKADQAKESANTGMWLGIAAGMAPAGGLHASVAIDATPTPATSLGALAAGAA